MIVLSSSFIDLLASECDTILSTGEVHSLAVDSAMSDSAKISYNDLRTANAKLIELEYTKKQLDNCNHIVYNDSIIIDACEKEKQAIYKKYEVTKKVAIGFGTGFGATILAIIITAICK